MALAVKSIGSGSRNKDEIVDIENKRFVDSARTVFRGETSVDDEAENWENYDRVKLNGEYDKNPFMQAYVVQATALTATDFRFVPSDMVGEDEEGLLFLKDFFKRFNGVEAEIKRNVRDNAFYLFKHGQSFYKREVFRHQDINGGNMITLRRSFFEPAEVYRFYVNKFHAIQKIELANGTIYSTPGQFFYCKQGTPSNYLWGESVLRQNYHHLFRMNRMMDALMIGMEHIACPMPIVKTNEEMINEIFGVGLGMNPELVRDIINNAKTERQTILNNMRRTDSQGIEIPAWFDAKYANTEVSKDIHSEVRELKRLTGENMGWSELLSSNDTNKASLSMNARQVQKITVKPMRKILIDDFIIPEVNNWFIQLGRPDLINSVTVEFESSLTIDSVDEADVDLKYTEIIGAPYARKIALKQGVSDEDVLAAQDRIAQSNKTKKPDEEENDEEDDDDAV